jgi:hypothetical protein
MANFNHSARTLVKGRSMVGVTGVAFISLALLRRWSISGRIGRQTSPCDVCR